MYTLLSLFLKLCYKWRHPSLGHELTLQFFSLLVTIYFARVL